MKSRFAIAAIVACLFAPQSARASDGQFLYQRCVADVPSSFCLGYVAGSFETMHANACPPANLQIGTAVDIVVRFLKRHPELRPHEASWLIQYAMEQAYPCQTSRNQ